jgi:hypothetical protein
MGEGRCSKIGGPRLNPRRSAMRYLCVTEKQIPAGQSALFLFVHRSELCAGVLERRFDGRVLRQIASDPQPTELVSVICELLVGKGLDEELLVVLDEGAYWPEAFPLLDSSQFYRAPAF